jgi:hypothetical protein
MAERDSNEERIMAWLVAQGPPPYPMLPPTPQPGNVVATQSAPESAPHSTGDAAAAHSPEVPEEREDPPADLPTHQPAPPPAHPTNELTDEEARHEFDAYQRKQIEFEAALCSITVPENRSAEFQSLLNNRGTTIPQHRYERAAHIVHRDKGWPPQRKLLELLVEMIHGREKVLDWHSRLGADHPCKVGPGGDRNMIAILKRTHAILNHGRALEVQEEVRRIRPVVQATQRQLPSPAAQPQLPLPLFSAMHTAQPPPEEATRTADDVTAAVSPRKEPAGAHQQAGHTTAASPPDSEASDSEASDSEASDSEASDSEASDSKASEEAEDSVADNSTHELNAPLSQRTHQRMIRYHRHQRAFNEELLFTDVAKDDELEFWKLFNTGPHQPGCTENTPPRIDQTANFERAAGIVRRNPDFRPSDRLLEHLRRTIRDRERAQRWWSRLHPGDKRSGRQDRHVGFINILKRAYRILSDGRAYSPTG